MYLLKLLGCYKDNDYASALQGETCSGHPKRMHAGLQSSGDLNRMP
jgi:hypothetical protein